MNSCVYLLLLSHQLFWPSTPPRSQDVSLMPPREYPDRYCQPCDLWVSHSEFYRNHHAGKCQSPQSQGAIPPQQGAAAMDTDHQPWQGPHQNSSDGSDEDYSETGSSSGTRLILTCSMLTLFRESPHHSSSSLPSFALGRFTFKFTRSPGPHSDRLADSLPRRPAVLHCRF